MKKIFVRKFFCPKYPKKGPKFFLSEVIFPKVFRPKVFDFNVCKSVRVHKRIAKLVYVKFYPIVRRFRGCIAKIANSNSWTA